MISKDPFIKITDALKEAGNYRIFNDVLREAGNFPRTIWYSKYGIKNVINWCSNDYLGMGQHKVVLDAMHTALDASGAGSGGTRNISGTTHYHVALEMEIASWHKKESALIHTSAFVANEWTLISLTKIIEDIEFVSDDNNHASLIQGILKSKAKKHLFKHNDMQDLEDKLKAVKGTPCLIFESVYSMEGDVGTIKEILDLADKYKAITYIDEVHAVGLYGETGAGWLEKIGLQDRVDIVSGSFSKAVGLHGGYIAGDKEILDAIRSISPGFIFTTSIPPVICAGALASVKYLKDDGGKELRRIHQEKTMELKTLLKDYNIEVYPNETHLVPVMVRDPIKAKRISDKLLYDHDIYVQPINYPTVAKGTERLRFAPTPLHTDAMVSDLADKLNEVYHEKN
jgi:5-aminolevulinate synthase|tara:strand:+ start:5573 stop:6769 length:1197 start_codon:yes stop_codon:yes gene_type:complete